MKNIIPVESITGKIYLTRGHKVLLDRDLAELYGGRDTNAETGGAKKRQTFS